MLLLLTMQIGLIRFWFNYFKELINWFLLTGKLILLGFKIVLSIKSVKDNFKIPVIAYQVSGEYSLLSSAINKNLINEKVILESLIAFKRAGANAIVSYYADRLDKILK